MGNASGRMDGSEPYDDRRESEALSGVRWPGSTRLFTLRDRARGSQRGRRDVHGAW